jgi:hypothetical protein
VYRTNLNNNFDTEISLLEMSYRPPETTDTEFYTNEINSFKSTVEFVFDEMYSFENSTNTIYSLLIFLSVIFFSILFTQNLTYADFIAILRLTDSGTRNFRSFFASIIVFFFYLFINVFLFGKWIFCNNTDDLSDPNYILQFLGLYLVIPVFSLAFIFKLWFSLFYYSWSCTNTFGPIGFKIRIPFFWTNCLRSINNAIFEKNGLAYIYLFRVYSLILTVCFSMLLFILYNPYAYLFSSERITTYLVYHDNNNEHLRNYNHTLSLLIIYQFMLLLFFYNYPTFSKTKQVFDPIFCLYDLRVMDALEVDKTCEKEVFESEFVMRFINFDTQSTYFYEYRHFEGDGFPIYSEVKEL